MISDTIENKVTDSYAEHLYHDKYVKDCSLCFAKKKRITDGILLLAKQQKPNDIHNKMGRGN